MKLLYALRPGVQINSKLTLIGVATGKASCMCSVNLCQDHNDASRRDSWTAGTFKAQDWPTSITHSPSNANVSRDLQILAGIEDIWLSTTMMLPCWQSNSFQPVS